MEHQHHTANQESGVVYTCPMHPEIKQNTPGQCPICGMNLEPVGKSVSPNHAEAETHHKSTAADVTQPRAKNMYARCTRRSCRTDPVIVQYAE